MNYLIYFLLFFLPLLIFPFGPSFFEIPKVIAAEVGIEVLLALFIFRKNGWQLKNYHPQQLFLLGLLFFLTLVHLLFARTETSFFGNLTRLQGIFLIWHLLVFSLLSAQINFKYSLWLPFISLVGLVLGGFILGGNLTGRVVSTLGEPNALAAATFFYGHCFF